MQSMGVTITDVAKECGVSVATVSRVIHKNPSISDETSKRVEKAIKKLGFVPNKRAQSFATQRSNLIVFATTPQSAYASPHKFEILSGLEKILSHFSYSLIFSQIEKGDFSSVGALCDNKLVDALVIHGFDIDEKLESFIAKKKMPTVIIGRPTRPLSLSWIDNDNVVSGEVAASCLINKGRKSFLFIGGKEEDNISESRLQGLKNSMKKNGLPFGEEDIIRVESEPIKAEKALKAIIDNGRIKKYDAIVAANNYLALGAINALNEKGIHVPSAISLITFDDYPFATFTKPKLSSVSVDMYSLGLYTARMVLNQIKNPSIVAQQYITVPLLTERSSSRYIKK